MVGLVCPRRREKRDRKIVDINMGFFVSSDIKNILKGFFLSIELDPNPTIRTQINMSSWIITIPDHLKTQEMCNEAVRIKPLSLVYVLDYLKTQEMCLEVVQNKPCMLLFVPNHLITQGMCNKIMRALPEAFHRIPDRFKTQEMCIKAVEVDSSFLQLVPDHFKMRGICDKAVRDDSSSLQYVPIGLLQGRGYICGMITVNIVIMMMKIIFLSGTMVIKNERLKKPQ